jgi:hypothetical protein
MRIHRQNFKEDKKNKTGRRIDIKNKRQSQNNIMRIHRQNFKEDKKNKTGRRID